LVFHSSTITMMHGPINIISKSVQLLGVILASKVSRFRWLMFPKVRTSDAGYWWGCKRHHIYKDTLLHAVHL